MRILLIIAALLLSAQAYAATSDWHTPPDKWSEPRIYHSAFDEEFSKGIIVSRGKIHPNSNIKKVFSPNNAYWYAVQGADYMKPGPYSTEILIYNERGYLISLKLLEHSQYEPKISWINEKLLYVEVWWGRILGTYLILDVEKEQVIYKEMIHDGVIPYQQYHEGQNTKTPVK
jgi:hypothetical protein